MRNYSTLKLRIVNISKIVTNGIVLFMLAGTFANAQYYKRVYADQASASDVTATPLLASVSDRDNAKATNGVQDASTLSVTLGVAGLVSASQNVRFTTAPATGTPVTVKFETGGSLLDVVGAVEVQATLNGTPVGKVYTDADLVGLLGGGVLSSGLNVADVTFVPKNNASQNVAYDGVRLKVTTLLGVGVSAKFYHAYYMAPSATPANCDEAVDAIYGVGGSIASLLSGVTNPYSIITGGGSPTTFNTGVTVGGDISETVIFSGVGEGTVEVVLSAPASLITLELLNGITLTTLNGSTVVDSRTYGSLLNLDLLGLFQSGKPATVRFPVNGAFDRVQIKASNLVSALGSLRIHDINRVLPTPALTTTNSLIYSGQSVQLAATSANASDIITWYTSDTTVITTGWQSTFTPTTSTTYLVGASLLGCSNTSNLQESVVAVLPLPVAAVLADGEVGKPYVGFKVIAPYNHGRLLKFKSSDLTSQTGLALDSLTGAVSGTPTAMGSFTFQVAITDIGADIASQRGLAALGMDPVGPVTTLTIPLNIKAAALPVKLASFSVNKEGEIAVLNWTTTSEVNSERFDIERRSRDGKWNAIGSKVSIGSESGLQSYSFIDPNPLPGVNYYRLKMIDLDETVAYSSIKSQTFDSKSISLYPNPVVSHENLTVDLKNASNVSSIKIINSLGQVVSETRNPSSSIVKTNHLTAGYYLVQVLQKDGSLLTSRFVKM